jgi:hypothetical protein
MPPPLDQRKAWLLPLLPDVDAIADHLAAAIDGIGVAGAPARQETQRIRCRTLRQRRLGEQAGGDQGKGKGLDAHAGLLWLFVLVIRYS